MDNIRDGKIKVFVLKLEVRRKLDELRNTGYYSRTGCIEYITRVERQIEDGERFLAMLNLSPYSNCKTVDELKQKISTKRNKLKKELAELDLEMEGHQISIFEILEPITEEERQAKELTIENLKAEIHWLHKCLGICKNKDYFNKKHTGK